MSEQQKALPVGYMASPTGIGRTYKCDAIKPGRDTKYDFTIVEFDDITGVIDGDRPGIAVEFQDDLATAEKQIAKEMGRVWLDDDKLIHRIAIDLPSARRFCCQLVTILASTGDEVAIKLDAAMTEILEEMRRSQ